MRAFYTFIFFFNIFIIGMWTLILYFGHGAPALMEHLRIGWVIFGSILAVLCSGLMFLHVMQYEQSMKRIADGLDEGVELLRSTLQASRKPSDIGPAPMTSPEPSGTGFMGGCQCSICTDMAEINAPK